MVIMTLKENINEFIILSKVTRKIRKEICYLCLIENRKYRDGNGE